MVREGGGGRSESLDNKMSRVHWSSWNGNMATVTWLGEGRQVRRGEVKGRAIWRRPKRRTRNKGRGNRRHGEKVENGEEWRPFFLSLSAMETLFAHFSR